MLNKKSVNFFKYINSTGALINKNNFSINSTKKKTNTKCKGFTIATLLLKNEIYSLKLIGQFDNKFLILLRLTDHAIIIFDQHAVHERILYEYYTSLLFNEIFGVKNKKTSDGKTKLYLFESIFDIFHLKKLVRIKCDDFNIKMNKFINKFDKDKVHNLFYFTFSYDDNGYITFYSFPIIFDKLHKIEKLIIIFATLINDIDYYLKLYQNQSTKFIDLFSYHIKSKACRNAVKFNDELEREFINELMQSLSLCNNPFLCAHGRHNFYLLKRK